MDYGGSFVYEVTGDSEADRREVSSEVEDNEDDAQSFICDSKDVSFLNGSVVVADDDEDEEEDENEDEGCCDDGWEQCQMGFCGSAVVRQEMIEEKDEEEGVVNEERPKRNVLISEMEDRLFWETCLATGY